MTAPRSSTAARAPAVEAWTLVQELVRDARGDIAVIARELELSPPQVWALARLEPGEPLPMGELAGHLRCDNSNVTGIVDRLERRGIVERRPAAHDRRVKHLVLTAEGEALRTRLCAAMNGAPNPFDRLEPGEQEALRDLLRRAVGDV